MNAIFRVRHVKYVLNDICRRNAFKKLNEVTRKTGEFKYETVHPMKKPPASIRKQIEDNIDVVLRSDPAASDGIKICLLYNLTSPRFQD